MLVGGVQILAMWILSLAFRDVIFPALGWLPLGGLALGFSLSNVIEVGLLLGLLRGRLGGLEGRALLSATLRMGAATTAMVGAIWLVLRLSPPDAVWMQAVLGTLAGGGVYLLLCWALGVEEMRRVLGMVRARLPR